MNTTVIVFIVLALLIAIAVVSVFALGGGEAGVRSAKDAVRELAERNGWTYVPGSIVGEHLYRIEGPGFTVRARNTRGSGPAREVGLNTAFVAERPVDGTLWIGTVDEVDAIDDLVGEPLELEPTSTGFRVTERGRPAAAVSRRPRVGPG